MKLEDYNRFLQEQFWKAYDHAARAKENGYDPEKKPESIISFSQAETIEKLLGLKGFKDRFEELKKTLPPLEIPFKIAEDIILGRFGSFSEEKAAELALKAALASLTPPGTTAAPIEGIEKVLIKRNNDNTRYLAVYFSGPMRSAGGTEQALSIILADFIRRILKLDRYKPTQEEVARYIEELRLYERGKNRFQYKVDKNQIAEVIENLPIEITGPPSEDVEVVIYRDLERVETNRLRGGALRIINDGIIGRVKKFESIINKLNISGWSWISKIEVESVKSEYLKEVLIGRPFFSSSERFGGFRIRYGRARNTGLMAVGIHPMSMRVLHGFLSIGSQLRIDRPGKSAIIMSVDSIMPPIVKTKDGSIHIVDNEEKLNKIQGNISKILFLGDILISLGDYIEGNAPLDKIGYTEEQWAAELEAVLKEKEDSIKNLPLDISILKKTVENPFLDLDFGFFLQVSIALEVPLHPRFYFFLENLSGRELVHVVECFREAKLNGETVSIPIKDNSLTVEFEKMCLPSEVDGGFIKVEKQYAEFFIYLSKLVLPKVGLDKNAIDYLNSFLSFKIKPKGGAFISARLGRPEAAKLREMNPPSHVLFPIGLEGGSKRNIVSATSKKNIVVKICNRYCEKCGAYTFYFHCPRCKSQTLTIYYCAKCNVYSKSEKCEKCGRSGTPYHAKSIPLDKILAEIEERLGIKIGSELKGVKSLMNKHRLPEPIEKGVLRAKYGLTIYKDGTIRFDATNAPLTAFKPREIGTPIDVLKKLGYDTDIEGNPLVNDDQLLYLYPQDVIIPCEMGDALVKIANFIDDELRLLYNTVSFYNAKRRDDLIGHLVLGISPHTLGAIVGRIIGYTDSQVVFAHPFWHQAKRRDCDGDGDSIILLLDAFLNFSKHYVPDSAGGLMDTPLIIMPLLRPDEIDDQVYNMEDLNRYSLKVYSLAWQGAKPKELEGYVNLVKSDNPNIAWTHNTSNIVDGVRKNVYSTIGSMDKKLKLQLVITSFLNGIDEKEFAENLLNSHLLKDISGNIRTFFTQKFRCKKCGKKFRRPPLLSKCASCGGELSPTVYVSGVKKYLMLGKEILDLFPLDSYFSSNIELLEKELSLLVSKDDSKLLKQKRLNQYF
ncbi:MAG: DNA polymerase II large subunit [Crenarchaeota archaeon]|nr:DNA polymerase II large subunit [Thermoproteota archaeon]MDW8034239.1 DNA polymerase II large subunit [Nitrososphaerota archaeon]